MKSDQSPLQSDTVTVAMSPGQLLRAAREARGIHLAVISVALKVPTSKLEALEKDDHSSFQDITFLRALARAVCRHVGADPAPVLAGLPQAKPILGSPRVLQNMGAAAPESDSPRGWRSIVPSAPFLLLALSMLTAIVVLIWWPAIRPIALFDTARTDASSITPVLQQASTDPANLSATAGASGTGTSAEVHQPSGQALTTPTATAGSSSGQGGADQAVSSIAITPSATMSQPGLQLRPKVDTWIEVHEGNGQILVRRLVKGGEHLRLDVQAPVFVYLGRADTTEVFWQGQGVDLQPHTQNNEVRLKIKP